MKPYQAFAVPLLLVAASVYGRSAPVVQLPDDTYAEIVAEEVTFDQTPIFIRVIDHTRIYAARSAELLPQAPGKHVFEVHADKDGTVRITDGSGEISAFERKPHWVLVIPEQLGISSERRVYVHSSPEAASFKPFEIKIDQPPHPKHNKRPAINNSRSSHDYSPLGRQSSHKEPSRE